MSPPLRRRSPSSLRGCKRIQLISHKTAEDSRNLWQDVCLFCSCFPFTNVYEEQGAAVLREVAIRTTDDGARNGRWQKTKNKKKNSRWGKENAQVFRFCKCLFLFTRNAGVQTHAWQTPVSAPEQMSQCPLAHLRLGGAPRAKTTPQVCPFYRAYR